ncbi:unnamed protein product [Darwinula stevensoni]|uniref:Uncharacterized protein n=1 Tax=Darwinula stevensoni TaxID=69355 RepID=A0A7R9FSH6_9CRUS|nr:unnamed protein product [Darwinula stevensoni]CAG0903776.1 unnamed protein product [Darwinula stevensoni]
MKNVSPDILLLCLPVAVGESEELLWCSNTTTGRDLDPAPVAVYTGELWGKPTWQVWVEGMRFLTESALEAVGPCPQMQFRQRHQFDRGQLAGMMVTGDRPKDFFQDCVPACNPAGTAV